MTLDRTTANDRIRSIKFIHQMLPTHASSTARHSQPTCPCCGIRSETIWRILACTNPQRRTIQATYTMQMNKHFQHLIVPPYLRSLFQHTYTSFFTTMHPTRASTSLPTLLRLSNNFHRRTCQPWAGNNVGAEDAYSV